MLALLISAGTRGDVQPAFALALALRTLGHSARLCIPPNFVESASRLGLQAVAMGVEMRMPASTSQATMRLDPEALKRLRASMPDLVADQFRTVAAAAEGCDVILGANAHQYAGPSIAEHLRVPCVTAVYAPNALPSGSLAPPPPPGANPVDDQHRSIDDQWRDAKTAWNERARDRINEHRRSLGLAPIDDVLQHALTTSTWLAADAALAPVPVTGARNVFQTGAWIHEDERPLPPELERFLAAGERPIYFGLGSMPAPPGAAHALIDAARAVGCRVVVSRGWAGIELPDDGTDCIAVDDVNHARLFPCVAVVVHHGGAGTIAMAARCGVPQVVTPMFGDQFYWASRIGELGLGSSVPRSSMSHHLLATALQSALDPAVAQRAQAFAARLPADGAMLAAKRLSELVLAGPGARHG